MLELLVAALALGLAGIDPAGLFIALGALAAGVRERAVIGFALVCVLGTALIGTVLAATLGPRLQRLDLSVLVPPDRVAALIELIIAAGLLVWGAWRLRRPAARPPRPRAKGRSGAALLVLGAVFAGSAVLDPTFLGLIVLGARQDSLIAVASANLTWVVLSQLPLVLLAVAVALRRHDRFVAWVQDFLARSRPALARVGTAVLVVAGLILATDALSWFQSGTFLIADSA